MTIKNALNIMFSKNMRVNYYRNDLKRYKHNILCLQKRLRSPRNLLLSDKIIT